MHKTDLDISNIDIKSSSGLVNVDYFKGTPTYIMLHGLGGSKTLFEKAFQINSNYGWGILAIDLLGFGESEKNIEIENYSLLNQSLSILDVINYLEVNEHYFVSHSMATALFPYLLTKNKETIGVVMLEGNLVKEDARWSKQISEFNDSEFTKYMSSLKKHASRIFSLQLHNNFDEKKICKWSKSFQVMDIEAFRVLAKETHKMTYSNKIIEHLKEFKGLKSYWRGEESEAWDGKNIINKINSQYNMLDNSSHYLMLDNPEKLYSSIYKYPAKKIYKT